MSHSGRVLWLFSTCGNLLVVSCNHNQPHPREGSGTAWPRIKTNRDGPIIHFVLANAIRRRLRVAFVAPLLSRMTYERCRSRSLFPLLFPLRSSSIIKIVLAFSGAIRFSAWGTIKFALPPQQQLMRERGGGEGPSILIRDFTLSLSQI